MKPSGQNKIFKSPAEKVHVDLHLVPFRGPLTAAASFVTSCDAADAP